MINDVWAKPTVSYRITENSLSPPVLGMQTNHYIIASKTTAFDALACFVVAVVVIITVANIG